MKQSESHYDRLALNIKIKLALRVRDEVTTKAITYPNGIVQISVKIGQTYNHLTRPIDPNTDTSDVLANEIYRRYYKNIFHKYFTAY